MKLLIRYDDERQYLELDAEDMDRLWISLSLEPAGDMTQEEKEKRLQDAFEVQLNRPDFYNWRRHAVHTVQPSILPELEEDTDEEDALANRAVWNTGFHSDEGEIRQFEDEEIFQQDCNLVMDVLKSKPHWAAAFIAVRMRGITVRAHAKSVGADETAVSHWLERAEKKLKKFLENRQT